MREIDNLPEFETWLRKGAKGKIAFQELDITKYEKELLKHTHEGSLFLGCTMSNHTAGHITQSGGLVILKRKEVLFEIHRAKLYTPQQLFRGFKPNETDGYKSTYDYKVYEEYIKTGMDTPDSILISFAQRLHDHSITDALGETIAGRKVVAIMGGHSMERQDPYYLKVAKISWTLTQKGFLMVSGGGPGAMEATHIGAYFACRTEKELEQAIDEMKVRKPGAPVGMEYTDDDWLHRAWKIMLKYPIPAGKEEECLSVGIPTWLYGHEPPAVFATQIAKYFANSIREDGLLSIAKHGVIFSPGSAGTIQEIFQDATQNHYAPYNTHQKKKYVSPMILFGKKSWVEEKPVWNLISSVAAGRPYGELLHLTDDENEIIHRITSYSPDDYAFPKS